MRALYLRLVASVWVFLAACATAGSSPTNPASVSPEAVEPVVEPPAEAEPEAEGPADPLAAARTFFAALLASDIPAALSLVAPERRERITADAEAQRMWVQAWTTFEVEVTGEVELEESGDKARVSVNLLQDGSQVRSTRVRFDLIDGRWYLNEN